MAKYFDIIPPEELRKMQKKSAEKRAANQKIRCKLALDLYKEHKDIQMVMSVLRVERRQAYKMIERAKTMI